MPSHRCLYAYVDTINEAHRLFVDELNATLVTVALDAKVQVAWDPAAVERYRLIGFENRSFSDSDRHFRLAATAAAFAAEVLRGSYWAEHVTMATVAAEALRRVEEFPEDPKVRELAELVTRAVSLAGDVTDQ